MLERGYLSIGFSDFADNIFLRGVIENGRDVFEKAFDDRWHRRPKTRVSLWNFITQMHTGDRIVVPSSGTFSVHDIVGDRALAISEVEIEGLRTWSGDAIVRGEKNLLVNSKTNQLIDLGFVWKVAPVATSVPRSSYADAALTARMKIRSTTANISDLNGSVEQALAAYRQSRPLNLHASLLSEQVRSTLSLIKTQLTPGKFEQLIQ